MAIFLHKCKFYLSRIEVLQILLRISSCQLLWSEKIWVDWENHLCRKIQSISVLPKTAWSVQSHYREVLQWGVSNGTRHNWKCVWAYIFFFLLISYIFDTSKCDTNYIISFEVWFHRSKDFEAMKAGKSAIWPKSSPNLNSCSIKISHRRTSL